MRAILLAWLILAAGAAEGADVARGERLYGQWCLGCHDRIGPLQATMPGTSVLADRYRGAQPGALADRKDLTPEFVRAVVRSGLNLMPHFRKTELSDAELDDVAAYLAAKPASARAPRR